MNTISKLLVAAAACATFAAQASVVVDNGANNSFTTAQLLNGHFSTEYDANIDDSTTLPHVSVIGAGNGGFDYYRFTVTADNTVGIFDIDNGMPDLDSWLNLYNADGTLLTQHDDGGRYDAGTNHPWDSYLTYNFAAAGDYVIAVGRFPNQPLNFGQDYTLNISTVAAVPEPETYAMLVAGLAAVGFARRRKSA